MEGDELPADLVFSVGEKQEGSEEHEKYTQMVARFKTFVLEKYKKQLHDCVSTETSLNIDFKHLEKFSPEMSEFLQATPDLFFQATREAIEEIDMGLTSDFQVPVRIKNSTQVIGIRDLRSLHIKKFSAVEGIVRKASEIRPEISSVEWECALCGDRVVSKRQGMFIGRPFECANGHKGSWREHEKKLVDVRWIVIEEPFELTEGDRPSQVTIMLSDDLCNHEGRRMTDPGNRIKICGVLRDLPKPGKGFNVKLDFYLDANHVEPTEIGWERVKVSKKDEETIKSLAADEKIYSILIDSLAPSLYGLKEIKEAVILQLFSGVQRHLSDKSRIRGEIHILLIGDPSSGKSQILKLVPNIVPRGKYVSGKGVTAAGLTASVSKDEQFMGGWVLEAGAMVLANKGLLAIDEFEKMSPEDQVSMHEALEQGSISIAKASIVTTLPAQTSVIAGGNPKFSRFDSYMPIAKQITIADTLLTRFDLKFVLRDIPNEDKDRLVVDHVLSSREDGYEPSIPKIDSDMIRKYIAYAKDNCKPAMTKECGKMLKKFYVDMRHKASQQGVAVPITLRQFEALIRLTEASAKIQLQDKVRVSDVKRAIRLMEFSLRQLGLDPDTGTIDIDKAEGASTPARERSQIRIILDVIEDLTKKSKEINIDELITQAKAQGIESPENIVERLKREGLLFEPSPGFVQKL